MSAFIDTSTGKPVAWRDAIPLRYEYTAGAAGEVFLRRLAEGRIVASKCLTCGELRLPPRAYCLECHGRARVDVELLHYGRIAALTYPREGRRRATVGFVTFEGVSGGLVHRILGAGRSSAKVGDPVRPVFLPPARREGSILDLQGFSSAVTRRGGNR